MVAITGKWVIMRNLKFGTYLVTDRGTLLMEIGLLHDYFVFSPHMVKNIIFVSWGACKVRLK